MVKCSYNLAKNDKQIQNLMTEKLAFISMVFLNIKGLGTFLSHMQVPFPSHIRFFLLKY